MAHGMGAGDDDLSAYFASTNTITRDDTPLVTFSHYAPRYECVPVWKSKFYGAFVLNRRVDLHAIDATPARWRGGVGSSPLDGASAATSSPRNDLVIIGCTRHTG